VFDVPGGGMGIVGKAGGYMDGGAGGSIDD
jgi:hypothetical protein